jgi:hypothetical protein
MAHRHHVHAVKKRSRFVTAPIAAIATQLSGQ